MDEIAILIPCYNEANTIGKVVSDFLTVMPKSKVYVYDNNSTDRTCELAAQSGAIVRHEVRQGKGNVVRTMFRDIDAKCYILVDGDDTYPANTGPRMADLVLNNQYDMVVGDRLSSTYFTENKRPFHNFGNSIVRSTINYIFGSNIKDVMTGYRAFSYQFVKTYPVLSKGFELETELTIHAVYNNMAVVNQVISNRDRPTGSKSKLKTIPDGIKVICTIFGLYRDNKPMTFFSCLALLLVVISLIFLMPVLNEYWKTGLVARFPTLIVCGFCILAAIISLFTGLILESNVREDRKQFEYQLQQVNQWYKESNKSNTHMY